MKNRFAALANTQRVRASTTVLYQITGRKNELYTEPQKKRRNFYKSIRYGKQSIYVFSLNYKFLLQHKVLVLITKS